MIGIIDYGAGNLKSVWKAFKYLELENMIIQSPEDINRCDKLVLPGVGAFEYAVNTLKNKNLFKSILVWINSGKPFLGICLGLQLLFSESEESPGVRGFDVYQGKVIRFHTNKVPQIGWNAVNFDPKSNLFKEIPSKSYFYFLHSYYVVPENDAIVTGKTFYNTDYTCMIHDQNVTAVQFHPEKSGDIGVQFLRNWSSSC